MATEAVEVQSLAVRKETKRLHLPAITLSYIKFPLREAVALGLIIGGIHFIQLSRADIEPKVQAAYSELHGDLQINGVERYREQLWRDSLPKTLGFGAMVFAGIGLLLPAAKQLVRPTS
ncbi:hypothetical protein HY025_02180 [Candidatus Daviesbacteria bacterium]|nr:hypothetical protein [Candidatus Daviesbacteria bacterium]